MPRRIALASTLSIAAFLTLSSRPARADFVTLKNGGEIRGEFLGDAKAKSPGATVAIRTLSGATVVVAGSEVETLVRRRLIAEEYETRRRVVSIDCTFIMKGRPPCASSISEASPEDPRITIGWGLV